jgi:hypothetical protein
MQSIPSKLTLFALHDFGGDVQPSPPKFEDNVCQTGGFE